MSKGVNKAENGTMNSSDLPQEQCYGKKPGQAGTLARVEESVNCLLMAESDKQSFYKAR